MIPGATRGHIGRRRGGKLLESMLIGGGNGGGHGRPKWREWVADGLGADDGLAAAARSSRNQLRVVTGRASGKLSRGD